VTSLSNTAMLMPVKCVVIDHIFLQQEVRMSYFISERMNACMDVKVEYVSFPLATSYVRHSDL